MASMAWGSVTGTGRFMPGLRSKVPALRWFVLLAVERASVTGPAK